MIGTRVGIWSRGPGVAPPYSPPSPPLSYWKWNADSEAEFQIVCPAQVPFCVPKRVWDTLTETLLRGCCASRRRTCDRGGKHCRRLDQRRWRSSRHTRRIRRVDRAKRPQGTKEKPTAQRVSPRRRLWLDAYNILLGPAIPLCRRAVLVAFEVPAILSPPDNPNGYYTVVARRAGATADLDLRFSGPWIESAVTRVPCDVDGGNDL